MRILISRLSALGDVVCSLPAAGALRTAFPDAHVTWVVDPRFGGIVECCEHVDEVIKAKPGFKPGTIPRFDEPFDVALDLQGLLKSGMVVSRAKAKEKLGYHWQREGSWLFSQRVLPDPSSFHIVDQYVDVARAAGGQGDGADFGLAANSEDLETVRAKLSSKELKSDFVVLNAGAGWESKRWPAAHFAKLVEWLSAQGIAAVLVGGRADADRDAASQVEANSSVKPVNMIGETTVRELVALISLAKAHVGGDTGSTHIAAALEVPAIGLYSITRPKRSCPYGQVERCLYDPVGLANISPDDAFAKLTEVL